MVDVNNKLKIFRGQAGLTQLDMAKRLNISESYYCQLENRTRRMSLDNALKIASILKRTPNELFLPSNFAKRQEKEVLPNE
jgi:transcriptional regulator with XRE-family HTH domain